MARVTPIACLVLLAFVQDALACSGPNAPATIAESERIGRLFWLPSLPISLVGFLGLFLFPERRIRALIILGLTAIHPGLWMDGRGGDCGYTLRYASPTMSLIILIATVLFATLPVRRGWSGWHCMLVVSVIVLLLGLLAGLMN
jgi:hypothetical protein